MHTSGLTYKAPKINKGCLVETIDKYHTGVAKLSPVQWRRNDNKNNDDDFKCAPSPHLLESRVIAARTAATEPSHRGYGSNNNPSAGNNRNYTSNAQPEGISTNRYGNEMESSSCNDISPRKRGLSGYERESRYRHRESSSSSGFVSGHHGHGPGRNNSLSPSKRRGSGGAYCVECNQWRHKFDFTKSQWRNRPRGFRRCKFCTGEVGSDSKQAPSEWSPRRYRLKGGSRLMNHSYHGHTSQNQ